MNILARLKAFVKRRRRARVEARAALHCEKCGDALTRFELAQGQCFECKGPSERVLRIQDQVRAFGHGTVRP